MAAAQFFRVSSRMEVLRSAAPRLARFACTGCLAGVIQLGLLHLGSRHGADALLANLVAFLIAAQVNFVLSATFTWGDLPPDVRSHATLFRRWVAFHGSIMGTALLNQAVFAAAHTVMPPLVAAALGIAVAAIVNFVLLDRVIFRPRAAHVHRG